MSLHWCADNGGMIEILLWPALSRIAATGIDFGGTNVADDTTLQMPWAAHRAREHLICSFAVGESFCVGVPLQLLFEGHGDIA